MKTFSQLRSWLAHEQLSTENQERCLTRWTQANTRRKVRQSAERTPFTSSRQPHRARAVSRGKGQCLRILEMPQND